MATGFNVANRPERSVLLGIGQSRIPSHLPQHELLQQQKLVSVTPLLRPVLNEPAEFVCLPIPIPRYFLKTCIQYFALLVIVCVPSFYPVSSYFVLFPSRIPWSAVNVLSHSNTMADSD